MVLKRNLWICLAMITLSTSALAEDWPMWRHDSSRLAVTSEQLDDANLKLHWKRQYAAPKPAWDKQQEVYCYGGPGYDVLQKLSFDIAYQPVVMGETMYVGSMNSDWVAAIDLHTGKEKWKFFTGGPVRFAPVAMDGKIYVGSDDGFMYCLNEAGQELWKIQGGPSNRKILGNDRLISVWPVRGGAMIPTELEHIPNPAYITWMQEKIAAKKNVFVIAQQTDDVEEKTLTGVMDVTSSDLELGRETPEDPATAQVIGLRFTNKFYGLKQGAVVNYAAIQFTVDETKGGDVPLTLRIYGEKSAVSETFSEAAFSVSSRVKTAAYVDWTVADWLDSSDPSQTSGDDQKTVDISTVINEMAAQLDWTAGSPITLIIETLSGEGTRCAESVSDAAKAPMLMLVTDGLVESNDSQPEMYSDINPAYIAWQEALASPEAKDYVLGNGNDDQEEWMDGSLYKDSSDLEITHDDGKAQVIGLRFRNDYYTIVKGGTVSNAHIQFQVDETKGGTDPIKVRITGALSGTVGQFDGSRGISGLPRTKAEVIWDIPTWTRENDRGPDQRTPDISAIINEIVGCESWTAGSAIAIIIEYIDGTGVRCAEARESGAGVAAKLTFDAAETVLVPSEQNMPLKDLRYEIGHNDSLMFAAGSYPFEGTFTYAVDKETGKVKWCNDKDYMYFTENPHSGSEGYNGNGPQGYLAAAKDGKILVPNGRNRPACFDAATGELLFHRIPANNGVSKGDGGYFCSTLGDYFYTNRLAGCKRYNLSDGKGAGNVTNYLMDEDHLVIMAGDTFFDAGCVFGYIPHLHPGYDDSVFKVAGGDFYHEFDARPAGLLAANGHLVVTTTDGWIYCFGEGEPEVVAEYEYAPQADGQYDAQAVADLVAAAGYKNGQRGNCIVIGLNDGKLVEGIARATDMTVIVFEENAAKVNAMRAYFDACGLYGEKVQILNEVFETADVPSYCGHVITSENTMQMSESLMREIYRVLRPYGGAAVIDITGSVPAIAATNAEMNVASGTLTLKKVGRLPGSDDWTHQHCNVQQTTLSRDELVKLPLGVAWFGGSQDNTNDEILPRHGHGPSPQVVGGRYYIQGLNVLRCVDVYTGRVLWEKTITNLGQFSNYTDHQAGQLAIGDNYISTEEKIYVLGEHADNDWPAECLVLDAATGEQLGVYTLPNTSGGTAGWGMIAVYEDYLIACGYPMVQDTYGIDWSGNRFPEGSGWVYGDSDPMVGVGGMGTYNGSTSAALVVMDRHTGEVKWHVNAEHGFFHNSIVAGNDKVFVMDRINWDETRKLESRDNNWKNGNPPDAAEDYSLKPAVLSAYNIADGSVVWQKNQDETSQLGLFGSWLAYSVEHDVLLECQRASRDYWEDHKSSRRMTAWKGADGAQIWSELDRPYLGGPVIIKDEMVVTQSGNDMAAINLLTGEPYKVPSALTGQEGDFAGFKRYGCGTTIGCTNMLLFRSGNAGYYDLNTFSGTGNWGGFKSGCTINLMPANGLLVAPEYTRTCGCSYQFQTSVAMIHRPDAEQWSCNLNLGKQFGASGGRMKHVGLNLGSIGDRVDADGVLWMEFPFGEPAVGFNYAIPVKVNVEGGRYYRHHSQTVDGDKNWVASSGSEGLTRVTMDLYDPAKTRFKDTIPQTYDVTLVFAEPNANCAAGDRVFTAAVNGNPVGTVDVVAQAGGSSRVLVKRLSDVRIGQTLEVSLEAVKGEPILSGVSVVMTDTAMKEGDLNNDGRIDNSDMLIIKQALRQAADGSDDPRDLDGDGMITILDARKLVVLMRNSK